MQVLTRLMSLALLLLILPQAKVAAEEVPVTYSQAELDQMLAPVALYPDSVLAQMLIAATYPLEIIEASEWSRAHPHLEGDVAVAAVEDKDWDPSVKAMVAFPDIIDRMERDLDWTTHLGDAFLRQEEQVMATIQDLRERAYVAGNLEAPANIRVYREPEVIIIEPVNPRVVYVPYYNPWTVYGSWWRPAHPPYYWAPRHHHYNHNVFYWGNGINFSVGFFYSNFDWHHRHTVVHVHHHSAPSYHKAGVPHYKQADFNKHYRKWQHKPARRHHEVHRAAQSRPRLGIESRQKSDHGNRVARQHLTPSRKNDDGRNRDRKPSHTKLDRSYDNHDSGNSRLQVPKQATRFQNRRPDDRGISTRSKANDNAERYSRVIRSLGAKPRGQKQSVGKRATEAKASQNPVSRLKNTHSARSGFNNRTAAGRSDKTAVSIPARQLHTRNLPKRESRPQINNAREHQSRQITPKTRSRGAEQRPQTNRKLAKPRVSRQQGSARPTSRQQNGRNSFTGKRSAGFSRSDGGSVISRSRGKLGR